MDNKIPEIKLEDQKPNPSLSSPEPKSSSVLVPDIPNLTPTTSPPKLKDKLMSFKLRSPKIGLVVVGIVVFLAVLVILVGLPAFSVYKNAKALSASVTKLEEAGKSKDLNKVKTELTNTRKSLANLDMSLKLMGWTRVLPFVGKYISDIQHATLAGRYYLDAGDVLIVTLEPYADLIGLKGGTPEPKDSTKTTQERLDFIVQSLPSIIPKSKDISEKIALAKKEIDQIDPSDYPTKFKGKDVRDKIVKAKSLASDASNLIIKGRPLLEVAPYLIGSDSSRNYFLLFMNDKEQRPTGGFMTAYAIMKVEKARVEPVSSNDIYNLDAKYKRTIPAPIPLVKYLRGPYDGNKNLLLRDMNWSPDFGVSMGLVTGELEKVGVKNMDGIIAVDTHLLVNLLNVTGPIGVPGYGNFSTKEDPECHCPQVIHELEAFADVEGPIVWDPAGTGKIIYKPPHSDNRKQIIGPLMNSVLANVLGQPKEKLPDLFEAFFRSMEEKHVLLYLNDKKAQSAAEDFGVGGKISEFKGDYLHINDANLGGRKSNLYTSQEVEQNFSVAKDGFVEKTVVITYKNSEKQDGWLNSILPNWVRVYVPEGSTLISFEGVDDKQDPYTELGKTVFAGFFRLRPQGVAKVTLKYKLPIKSKGSMNLLIQKQPGVDKVLYRTKIGNKETEEVLKTDKEFRIAI